MDMTMQTRRRQTVALALVAVVAFPWRGMAADEVGRCDRAEARDVVARFIASYNHGNIALLDRIFASEPDFAEYSVRPLEREVGADDRATLMDYFRNRHEHRDRMRLRSLDVGEEQRRIGGFWVRFTLLRTSEDPNPLAQGRYLSSKSSMTPHCQIRLWRMNRKLP